MTNATPLDRHLIERLQQREAIVNVDEPTVKLVIFRLGEANYAFIGNHIREIIANQTTWYLPGSPPFLEGVINVRGDIEAVMLLPPLLQLAPSANPSPHNLILIGQSSNATVSGIRVDEVIDVADYVVSEIQPPPANLADNLRPWVQGVSLYQQRPITLLDLDRIFDHFCQRMS
jgi:purine-binding chemotaxis protein CheW